MQVVRFSNINFYVYVYFDRTLLNVKVNSFLTASQKNM